MTQKEFEEQYVFELYKDKEIVAKKKFEKEVKKYRNIDAREMYIKIKNYQKETYGGELGIHFCAKVDLKKLRTRSNQRKYASKRVRGIEAKTKEKRWTNYD